MPYFPIIKKYQKRSKISLKLSRSYFSKRNGSKVFLAKTALLLPVIVTVYFIFFSRFFLMEEIEINGNNNIQTEDIKNIVKDEVFKPIFGFVPGNNFLLNLNRDNDATTILLSKFPEIESIKIEKKLPNKMKINIIEKHPKLIWCFKDDCYYIDDNGMVLAPADKNYKTDEYNKFIRITEKNGSVDEYFEDKKTEGNGEKNAAIFLNKIEETEENVEENEDEQKENSEYDRSLAGVKIGDRVSDKDFIDFAIEADREIKKNTILKVRYYETRGTKTRELVACTENNIKIYFDAMRSAKNQAEDLRDFLDKGVVGEDINKIKYIYLKSDNKIFYR